MRTLHAPIAGFGLRANVLNWCMVHGDSMAEGNAGGAGTFPCCDAEYSTFPAG